jgi:Tol biopolymer transport system component
MTPFTCPHCNQSHPTSARFCPITGKTTEHKFHCSNCGEKILSVWNNCPQCGHSFNRSENLVDTPQKLSFRVSVPIFVSLLVVGIFGISVVVCALWSACPISISNTRDTASLVAEPEQPTIEPRPEKTEDITNRDDSTLSFEPTSTLVPEVTSTPHNLLPLPGVGKIVFAASVDGKWQVMMTDSNGANPLQLTDLPDPGAGDPAISPDGSLVALVHDGAIYSVRTDGSELSLVYQSDEEAGYPAWSPDGKKIIFAVGNEDNFNLYTVNMADLQLNQVTRGRYKDVAPHYSPDGEHVAFSSNRSGKWEVHILTLENGSVEQITRLRDLNGPNWPCWSPDGKAIVFESVGESKSRDIYTIEPDGSSLNKITSDSFYNGAPAWSPGSDRIAFVSNRDDGLHIFVIRRDGSGIKKMSNHWAWGPSWSMTFP